MTECPTITQCNCDWVVQKMVMGVLTHLLFSSSEEVRLTPSPWQWAGFWWIKKRNVIFLLKNDERWGEVLFGDISYQSRGDVGNICQGISLKRLKSSGRELCEDSIRELILQNVRLTLLQSVADHFTAQLERHRELCTALKLAQSVFNYFMSLRVNHTHKPAHYHPWLFFLLVWISHRVLAVKSKRKKTKDLHA